MNAPCQCSRERTRRVVKNGAGWIIPGTMLALLPKCPLCLAAWLSLLFGIGLSATMATTLYITLITLCAVTALVFLIRQIRAALRQSSI